MSISALHSTTVNSHTVKQHYLLSGFLFSIFAEDHPAGAAGSIQKCPCRPSVANAGLPHPPDAETARCPPQCAPDLRQVGLQDPDELKRKKVEEIEWIGEF